MTSITDLMRLLQFGDSMLPVGAFAFSNGLEAAIQQRVVYNVDSLTQFVQTALGQGAATDGIALIEAHRGAVAGDVECLEAEGWSEPILYPRLPNLVQLIMIANVRKQVA